MTEHILSLSYGKDSLACLGAIEKLGWPLDRIEWRCPDGYEGLYLVSNFGAVYSIRRKKILSPDNVRGYLQVTLQKSGVKSKRKVHRLVAELFVPNPNNFSCVNHKDENKKNNCVENLEWVTHQGNVIHAVETGLFGERAKKATPEIVEAIRAEYVPYDREHSTIALGKKYGIDPAYVWRIINGQKRKRLP